VAGSPGAAPGARRLVKRNPGGRRPVADDPPACLLLAAVGIAAPGGDNDSGDAPGRH
jgi:hypothetical protein